MILPHLFCTLQLYPYCLETNPPFTPVPNTVSCVRNKTIRKITETMRKDKYAPYLSSPLSIHLNQIELLVNSGEGSARGGWLPGGARACCLLLGGSLCRERAGGQEGASGPARAGGQQAAQLGAHAGASAGLARRRSWERALGPARGSPGGAAPPAAQLAQCASVRSWSRSSRSWSRCPGTKNSTSDCALTNCWTN